MKLSTDRQKSLACVLAIIVLAILFMGQSLLPDKMLAPLDLLMGLRPWSRTEPQALDVYNGLPSDKVLYIQPIKVLVGQAWRSGLPLWEPHLLSGYPIIGNAQAGIFYPGTLPYIFLPGADASDLVALFHLIVAGLGMLGYLRALRCHYLAALLGAIVFMLNSVFIVWLMWDSVAGVMVWLPWALWAFEAALRLGRFWIAALGAGAVALIYLGGHLQWSLYAMLALGLYSLFRLIYPKTATRRRVLGIATILMLTGTALAAIQLLPTLDYIRSGTRGPIPFDVMSSTLSWSGFLMLWVPRYFGSGFLPPAWWGPINYNESMIYVGIAPLLLAIMAIIRRVKLEVVFFLVLGLFGALCAAGTPMYQLLHWLPGFDSLMPMRMRYLIVISLSVLCALGLDEVLRRDTAQQAKLTRSILFAALILGVGYIFARNGNLPQDPDRVSYLSGQELLFVILLLASVALLILSRSSRLGRYIGLAGICVLTLIDLWQVGVMYQRPISTQFYYPTTDAIELIAQDKDLYRVLTLRRSWSDWSLKPDLPAMFGLADVGGYDSIYPQRYSAFLQQIDKAGSKFAESNFLAPSRFDSPLVDLLNVKYVITPDKSETPGWNLVSKAGMRVYAREQPLPRVWIAAYAQVVENGDAILDQLSQPDFDPRRTVILEQAPSEPLGTDTSAPAGTAAVEVYENTHLVLNANMQRQGWLVLSEMFYPGWRVTVDGVPANLYRADFLLRAVPLAAGSHRIEMWFLPDSFVVGSAISAISVLALIAVALLSRRIEKHHQSSVSRS